MHKTQQPPQVHKNAGRGTHFFGAPRLVLLSLMALIFICFPGGVRGQLTPCNGCGKITGLPISDSGCIGSVLVETPVWNVGTYDYNLVSYVWSPSIGVTASSGTTFGPTAITVPTTCTTYKVVATAITTINEVTNGSFESGMTGWSTGYTLGSAGGDLPACDYATTDHSTAYSTDACGLSACAGTNFFMANGCAYGGAGLPLTLLSQPLTLCCGQKYRLSFCASQWSVTTAAAETPQLQVYLDGVLVNTFDIGGVGTGCSWSTYTMDIPTPPCDGGSKVVTIAFALGDASGTIWGNDIALDNIQVNRYCTDSDSVMICPPTLPTMTGPVLMCLGDVGTYTSSTPGGTWTCTSGTITSDGVFTPTGSGMAVITYIITLPPCSPDTLIDTVIVNPSPIAYIEPSSPICDGSSFDLTAHSALYTCPGCNYYWNGPSPYDPVPVFGISTTVPGGVPTGSVFVYTLTETNAYGCTASATVGISANIVPSAAIAPGWPPTICSGTDIVFTGIPVTDDLADCFWTLGGPVTSLSSTPTTNDVMGVSCGAASITYTVPSLYCGTAVASETFGVAPTPDVTITSVPAAIGTPPAVLNCGKVVLTGSVPKEFCIGIEPPVNFFDWTPVVGIVAGTPVSPVITVDPPGPVETYTLNVSNTYGCSGSATISVVTPGPKCVCSLGEPYVPVGVSGTFTPSDIALLAAGGNFIVNNPVLLTAGTTVAINHCVVIMAAGVSITVPDGTTELKINHSHLLCCTPDMWQGIVLDGGSTPAGTGILSIYNNSLIEDAMVAVDVLAPVYSPTYSSVGTSPIGLLINSTGTVFNKDITGIRITGANLYDYPVGAETEYHPGLPFVIENTVFTCRDFATAYGTSWPYSWPHPAYLKGITGAPTPYDPPYVIDGAYTRLDYCNDGSIPMYGIDLENAGHTLYTAGIAFLGTELYTNVVVGSQYTAGAYVPNTNLFDNLYYGIYSHNSDLLCRNSIFMHMGLRNKGGGTGIYAFRDVSAATAVPQVLCGLDVYGNATGYWNSFYDCGTCVFGSDLYYTKGVYSQMCSKHSSSAIGDPQGQWGYQTSSTEYYDVDLSYNTITNIKNAISFNILNPVVAPISTPVIQGWITVNNNTIHAVSPAASYYPAPTAGEYVYKGISVQNVAGYWDGACAAALHYQINTDDNVIDNAYNGIYILGAPVNPFPPTTSQNNTISLALNILPSAAYEPQAGIDYVSVGGFYIYSNTISGPGYDVPYMTLPGPYSPPIVEGIHVATTTNVNYVTCNTVSDMNTGFYFGQWAICNWLGNTMQRNEFGYVLDGTIGIQPYIYGGPTTTGNVWSDDAITASWPGWAGDPWQTYVINGAVPTSSPMTVLDPSVTQNPTANGTPTGGFAYALGISIFTAPVDGTDHCYPAPLALPPSIPVHVDAARKHLDYYQYAGKKYWCTQMGLSNTLAGDSTMDSNAVLHAFKAMATGSRFQLMRNLISSVGTGDYITATGIVGYPIDSMMSSDSDAVTGAVLADDTGADNIVANYRTYYALLTKFATDTLNAADSAAITALAGLCPSHDGAVVYNARALYSHIYGDLKMWPDMGCDTAEVIADRRGSTKGNNPASVVQQYLLSPNPNNGSFILTQASPKDGAVDAEIWNAIGVMVENVTLDFKGGRASGILKNPVPGVYTMRVAAADGSSSIIKFTVL